MTLSSGPSLFTVANPHACAFVLRGALSLIVIIALLATAVWSRVPLLRSAADLWIISAPVDPADAVAIFRGGLENRPFAAAAYSRQGLVGKILLSNIGLSPSEQLGVLDSYVEADRKVLLRLGVPNNAIETFGYRLRNTYQEAQELQDWVAYTGARNIIVPTEIFST